MGSKRTYAQGAIGCSVLCGGKVSNSGESKGAGAEAGEREKRKGGKEMGKGGKTGSTLKSLVLT